MATIGGRGWVVVVLAAGLLACGDAGDDAGGSAAGGAGGEAAGGSGGSAAGGAGGIAAGGAGGVAIGLSQAEIDALLFTREEEKLARDVYAALEGFGPPFTNIQASEQSHMDALLALIVAYGLDDPAEGRAAGSFANEELQALHDALVAQGTPGAIEALQVGCAIEELDLRDIEVAQQDVTHDDLRAAYDTLLLGSRNHLRAFYGRLQGLGGTYTPQYVSQAHFDEIVGSPHERP